MITLATTLWFISVGPEESVLMLLNCMNTYDPEHASVYGV